MIRVLRYRDRFFYFPEKARRLVSFSLLAGSEPKESYLAKARAFRSGKSVPGVEPGNRLPNDGHAWLTGPSQRRDVVTWQSVYGVRHNSDSPDNAIGQYRR